MEFFLTSFFYYVKKKMMKKVVVESVCQKDLNKKVKAIVCEEKGKVYLKKICGGREIIKELISNDPALFEKWMKYESFSFGREQKKIPVITGDLYPTHLSSPLLVNLLVTNRCDMRCWYCFMNAGATGYVYEPSLEKLKEMMRKAKKAGALAIQITGGEPTIRRDLLEILRFARDNFAHVQLNTNGIRIATDLEFTKRLKGLINTVYISFDGVSKKTNPWIDYSIKAIENLKKSGIRSVVLVPTVRKDNLSEVGKIVKLACNYRDVIKAVIFQPIAFAGRIEKINQDFLKKYRIDYVEIFEVLEREFNNEITRWDFYPVCFVDPIRRLLEKIKNKQYPQFSPHPMCGGATYIFYDREKKKLVPITRFIDVEGLIDFIKNDLLKKKGPLLKLRILISLLLNVRKFIIKDELPKDLRHPILMIIKTLMKGDYETLGKFHKDSILVGSMWFQDPWNIQISRVEKCVIQYITEEGLISFCLYNGLRFGDKLREKHGEKIKEWEKRTGRKIKDDIFEEARKNPILLTGKIK